MPLLYWLYRLLKFVAAEIAKAVLWAVTGVTYALEAFT
jgi:hypothetical protein